MKKEKSDPKREREDKAIKTMFGFKVKETFPIIKDREIHVPRGDKHYVYPEAQTLNLLMFLEREAGEGNNIYISGPSGTGKTQLVLNVLDKLNWPMTRLDCDSYITRSSLIGAHTVRGKEMVFQYGAIPTAMKEGHVLLINEYDTINPMAANILKSVLDPNPTLIILENGGEVIEAHPDFRVVATANTWARGDESGMFTNTHIQSIADIRRFGCFLKMDYMSEKAERKMLMDRFQKDGLDEDEARDMVVVGQKIREANQARKINRTFSPAEMINWARTYVELNHIYEAARLTFLNSYSVDEQIAVSKMVEEVWGVEKTKDDAITLEDKTSQVK